MIKKYLSIIACVFALSQNLNSFDKDEFYTSGWGIFPPLISGLVGFFWGAEVSSQKADEENIYIRCRDRINEIPNGKKQYSDLEYKEQDVLICNYYIKNKDSRKSDFVDDILYGSAIAALGTVGYYALYKISFIDKDEISVFGSIFDITPLKIISSIAGLILAAPMSITYGIGFLYSSRSHFYDWNKEMESNIYKVIDCRNNEIIKKVTG